MGCILQPLWEHPVSALKLQDPEPSGQLPFRGSPDKGFWLTFR